MEAWSSSLDVCAAAALNDSDRVSASWDGIGDGDASEYAIDAEDADSGAFNSELDTASPTIVHDADVVSANTSTWATSLPRDSAATQNSIVTKRFAQKRRDNGLDGDIDNTCCGRCKSNLNGKLIVRCASCSFRRHLYCFSPPLQQHPVSQEQIRVTALGTKVRVRPSPAAIVSWTCDDCRRKLASNQSASTSSGRSGTFAASVSSTSLNSTSQAVKLNAGAENTAERVQALSEPSSVLFRQVDRRLQRQRVDDISHSQSSENEIESVQDKWRRGPHDAFDWYAFRDDKARAVQAPPPNEASTSATELVYYAKPFVDMKKTALGWMTRVEQHKRSERQRALREMRKQLPPKRNVMLTLTEIERQLVEQALARRQQDAAREAELFDDTRVYEFNISLDRIQYLRQPRPSSVRAATLDIPEHLESVTRMLCEAVEAVALGCEDADVRDPDDSVDGSVGDSVFVGGNVGFSVDVVGGVEVPVVVARPPDSSVTEHNLSATAARSAYIRWRYKTKRLVQLRHRREDTARQQLVRRASAQASIRLLQRCIRFVMLLVRAVRDVHVKKALLLALQEAAEDTKVGTTVVNESERVEQLAQRRIQRFFVRRVRPYIRLKKRVMSRRIRRWWKRTFLTYKWRESARVVRVQWRERASRRIQRAYRRFRTKRTFAAILETHALRKVKTFLRSWLMTRVIKKETTRVAIFEVVVSFNAIPADALSSIRDAPVDTILFALGSALYSHGEFWSAAAILERAYKLCPTSASSSHKLALAYSHHMTWHMSYDAHNLTQAYEMYCAALHEFAQRSATSQLSEVDPFVLQEAAIVMMQMENFGGSLRMLARLIECFPQYDGFPLWLLLAAVQLQQRGEWRQSVEYLTYLQDMAPSPYLERDILALCAIALEHQTNEAQARSASREAWSAALRQWSLEQKTQQILHPRDTSVDLWAEPSSSSNDSTTTMSAAASRTTQSLRRKWDLLHDFAQRATSQGHYLLACRLLLHMLEIRPDASNDSESETERSERAAVWWTLADVFRHLGHLDLYVDATARSYQCIEAGAIDAARRDEWARDVATRARSFRDDIERLSTLELLRALFARNVSTLAP